MPRPPALPPLLPPPLPAVAQAPEPAHRAAATEHTRARVLLPWAHGAPNEAPPSHGAAELGTLGPPAGAPLPGPQLEALVRLGVALDVLACTLGGLQATPAVLGDFVTALLALRLGPGGTLGGQAWHPPGPAAGAGPAPRPGPEAAAAAASEAGAEARGDGDDHGAGCGDDVDAQQDVAQTLRAMLEACALGPMGAARAALAVALAPCAPALAPAVHPPRPGALIAGVAQAAHDLTATAAAVVPRAQLALVAEGERMRLRR